jgi:hypothetical protein
VKILVVIFVDINNETLSPYLIYSRPYEYKNITLYPICMDKILEFLILKDSIIVRKDSTFREKAIIKMKYYDFLIYCAENPELEIKYKIPNLRSYFQYAFLLLQIVCQNQTFKIIDNSIYINDIQITPEIFDDLRRIIILQNGIDFNIDEFIHYDTEQALKKAQSATNKDSENSIEDLIDSLIIVSGYSEEQIMKMSIRKFWRYIKRFDLHENYVIRKTGEQSGMVKYNEPIKHWTCSLDENDKYKDVKADETAIKGKING